MRTDGRQAGRLGDNASVVAPIGGGRGVRQKAAVVADEVAGARHTPREARLTARFARQQRETEQRERRRTSKVAAIRHS